MKMSVTELHRLVGLDDTARNSESWFIARALRLLKKTDRNTMQLSHLPMLPRIM